MADSAEKKKATVATPSMAHGRMMPKWSLVDALLGGTEAMRLAGKTYLPQYDQESNNNYDQRLARSVLFNGFEIVLEALVGRPFAEPVGLGEDVPAKIEELTEDVDLQGNNLQSFARSWFRTGWAKGLGHVLVDFPVVPTPAEGEKPRTLEDDRIEGLRPYWVHIAPEAIIAAYAEVVDGQERLTHVRIMEETVERVGWEEVITQRVRVLEPGLWELWAPVPDKKDEWFRESWGTTGLDEIPLVTFYGGQRIGLHECKPPLTDVAHLNVSHWQSSSDQRNVLTVARFPILAGKGVPADMVVKFGPLNYLATEDAEGEWYYVEHTGAAIEAGRKDLEDLKAEMAGYGAEFLRKRPGNEAASNRLLDSSEGTSYLEATVQDFQNCLEEALLLTAKWMKLEDGGSVVLSMESTEEEANPAELDALVKARAARDISRVAYLNELKRRNVLSEDFDADADAELLLDESEQSNMTGPDGTGAGQVGDKHPNGAPRFDAQGKALDPDGNPVEDDEEEEEAE